MDEIEITILISRFAFDNWDMSGKLSDEEVVASIQKTVKDWVENGI